MNVAAAINIHSIAVGIFLYIADGEVVNACCQNTEPSAMQYGYIGDINITAFVERDSFVGSLFAFNIIMIQPFAPDKSLPNYRYIVQVFAPYQTVMEMAVPRILVSGVNRVLFFVVIVLCVYLCRYYSSALVDK